MPVIRIATAPALHGADIRVGVYSDADDSLLETITASEIGQTGIYTATSRVSIDAWAHIYAPTIPSINSAQRITPNIKTISADISALVAMEYGEWRIVGTQMIFNNVQGAELARFDLLDASGNPASNAGDAYWRKPV